MESANNNKNYVIASLVLGISSFLLSVIPGLNILSLPCAILAIVFGAKRMKEYPMAKVGFILGVIYTTITALAFIILLICILLLGISIPSIFM